MSRRVFVLRDATFSASAVRADTFLVRLGDLAYVDFARASMWTVQMKKRGSNCNTKILAARPGSPLLSGCSDDLQRSWKASFGKSNKRRRQKLLVLQNRNIRMNSLTLPTSVSGKQGCSFVSGSNIHVRKRIIGEELQISSFMAGNGLWFRHLQPSGCRRCKFSISARIKKGQKHEYPWPDDIDPNLKSGHLSYLSYFKPLTEKPKPVTLDFEKPLVELQKKLTDVGSSSNLILCFNLSM
ncbi:Acetyl-coenzyme A carboxylase carboxyl transferase subunit alpha, chloroplastic [Apostasia shenzhenica]|uniref:Acetyl-coenzyme A carboxylase carboxyl transferase subunit alpha, chloroplastic n=1 Tax=Apostasia shenzhenica TaxID=1088818 RepID=A0A2I0ACD2_9ASPA|nr:Acetyl-coenzyme A carboxylase carboxyl transferase subunit alpha, chloroplastic [Apostasia shenzhenica]